jgi:hypothetical protein
VVPGQEAPTSHGKQIPPGYYSVGVDRVVDEYKKLALEFEGGDGEKTLGQAEHSCIIWHKRYIIIPNPVERAPSPPPQLAHDRCGLKLTEIVFQYLITHILNYWLFSCNNNVHPIISVLTGLPTGVI